MEYFYLIISVLGWGTIATVSKYFLSGLSPYYILSTTSLVALVVLVIIYAKDIRVKIKSLNLKTALLMIGVGCLGISLYNIFIQMGIARLPAQQAFVINYLWPSFIVIFSAPILKEKITPRKLIAIFIAFLGVAIIASDGNLLALSDVIGSDKVGVISCLVAAICYGLYTPLNKKQTYDKDMALVLSYAFAVVVAGVISFSEGSFIKPSSFQLVGIIIFGVCANALAYVFWVKAMEIGSTAILSNLVYLTPVVSLVATHFVLGEEITRFSIIGLALILVGALIQSLKRA